MTDPAVPAQRVARQLIAQEAGAAGPGSLEPAAGRVCEKLRGSLSKLIGIGGYGSLLTRAVTLARRDAPELAGVEVKPDATLTGFPVDVPGQGGEAAAHAALLVVTHLLALLHTFIGQDLTARLLRDVWPDAPVDDRETGPQERRR